MTQTPCNFVSPGNTIPHTQEAAVTGGEVIVRGNFVVIAKADVAAGKLGSVAIDGLFDGPKPAGWPIGDGQPVFWRASLQSADGNTGAFVSGDGSSGVHAGWCVKDAEADDETVRFRLSAYTGIPPYLTSAEYSE